MDLKDWRGCVTSRCARVSGQLAIECACDCRKSYEVVAMARGACQGAHEAAAIGFAAGVYSVCINAVTILEEVQKISGEILVADVRCSV